MNEILVICEHDFTSSYKQQLPVLCIWSILHRFFNNYPSETTIHTSKFLIFQESKGDPADSDVSLQNAHWANRFHSIFAPVSLVLTLQSCLSGWGRGGWCWWQWRRWRWWNKNWSCRGQCWQQRWHACKFFISHGIVASNKWTVWHLCTHVCIHSMFAGWTVEKHFLQTINLEISPDI